MCVAYIICFVRVMRVVACAHVVTCVGGCLCGACGGRDLCGCVLILCGVRMWVRDVVCVVALFTLLQMLVRFSVLFCSTRKGMEHAEDGVVYDRIQIFYRHLFPKLFQDSDISIEHTSR